MTMTTTMAVRTMDTSDGDTHGKSRPSYSYLFNALSCDRTCW